MKAQKNCSCSIFDCSYTFAVTRFLKKYCSYSWKIAVAHTFIYFIAVTRFLIAVKIFIAVAWFLTAVTIFYCIYLIFDWSQLIFLSNRWFSFIASFYNSNFIFWGFILLMSKKFSVRIPFLTFIFSANVQSRIRSKFEMNYNRVSPTELDNLIRLGFISTQLDLIPIWHF